MEAVGRQIKEVREKAYYARIGDLLMELAPADFSEAIRHHPRNAGSEDFAYLASMIDYACAMKGVNPPTWLSNVPPLAIPWFASDLSSLKLYMLIQSPVAFRKRNIFVDSTFDHRR
jgi:hypothetical protein